MQKDGNEIAEEVRKVNGTLTLTLIWLQTIMIIIMYINTEQD
jgi:hypothetical protein